MTAASCTLLHESLALIRKEGLLSCLPPIRMGSWGSLTTCSSSAQGWARRQHGSKEARAWGELCHGWNGWCSTLPAAPFNSAQEGSLLFSGWLCT